MSDPSRFNSPSRKSRFRAQGRHLPAGYAQEGEATEEGPAEELAVTDEAGTLPDHDPAGFAAEDAPADDPATHDTDDDGDEHIPAALRLTRSSDSILPVRRGTSPWGVILWSLAALAAGAGAGYFYGNSEGHNAGLRVGQKMGEAARIAPPIALDPQMQAAIETAFTDTKAGKYEQARNGFDALFQMHPEWPSMEIEAARAALYQRDFQATQALLSKATHDRPLADAAFLSALVHLTAQEFDAADTSFASAAATDPARADIYYFWGETLRREGKPREAAEKFKAALVRNQYENMEALYQLKYWLSLVQADQESSSGEGAKIDAILASDHPTGTALFAGAARAVKVGQFQEAARLITKAQAITDPSVFKVILNDPTFMEANLRPDIVGFYK